MAVSVCRCNKGGCELLLHRGLRNNSLSFRAIVLPSFFCFISLSKFYSLHLPRYYSYQDSCSSLWSINYLKRQDRLPIRSSVQQVGFLNIGPGGVLERISVSEFIRSGILGYLFSLLDFQVFLGISGYFRVDWISSVFWR